MKSMLKRAAVLPVLLVATLLVPGAGAAPAVDSPSVKHSARITGIDLRAEVAAAAKVPVWKPSARLAAPPASYDLSQFAPPVGDQGSVGSCTAWGVAYSAVSLLMNRQGITGAPMAPMYIYSQIARGYETGTTIPTVAQMLVDQGVETRSLYWQGDYDFTTQPTVQQRAHAANYKLTGYDRIAQGTGTRIAIKTAIAAGRPVVFSFKLRESFDYLDDENSTYTPGNDFTDPYIAGHVVAIVGYDENSVRVLNSWGVNHGADGYFTTSWSTIESRDQVKTIYALRDMAG